MRLKRIWRHLTRACLHCGRRPARVGRCRQCFILEMKDPTRMMLESVANAPKRPPQEKDTFMTFRGEDFVVKNTQTGDTVKEGELQ